MPACVPLCLQCCCGGRAPLPQFTVLMSPPDISSFWRTDKLDKIPCTSAVWRTLNFFVHPLLFVSSSSSSCLVCGVSFPNNMFSWEIIWHAEWHLSNVFEKCIVNLTEVIWYFDYNLMVSWLIYRSLQIFMDTGVPHSQLLEEQRGQDGGDCLGGPLRFQDPCIFWLHCKTNGSFIVDTSL